MAADDPPTNATSKPSKAKVDKMNGQQNGSIHGTSSRSSQSRRKQKQTYSGWVIDKGAKLLVWYTLITVFIRCPSTPAGLTDKSPQICKPYLQARDYVTPYAQPYYEQYLAPYVHKVQPYYDQVNEKLYKPGYAAYEKYGAPRVAQAQAIGEQQWQKTVKPQLDLAQKQAGVQYEKNLAPHVKKATDVVQPYYDRVVSSASDIWELELEPVYRRSAPVAQKLYLQGQNFAVNTALPQAQYVGNTAWTLWTRQVWPKMRILYGENVEPQLLRITERLGRYKDGKKLEAEIKSMETSSKLDKASSSIESVASSVASTISEATASPSSAASVAASQSPKSSPDPAVQFQEDLTSWEHVSAKAVEEGAEDLMERIKDITQHQVSAADGLGSALVTQLEQTSEAALNSVKARIQQIVNSVPEDADGELIEAANDDLIQSIRAAGQSIKQRAQAVREWRQASQLETESLVFKAIESTLETIDSIRELRLTEIGRKYASSSLPHKEWSKYNDIKKNTHSWRREVELAAHAHPGLAEAKTKGNDVENTAMAVAEDAAKELGRLKEVGKWKIAAADASDDFASKTIPAPVRRIKDQIVAKVSDASEAAFGTEQGAVESATSVAAKKAAEAASKASEAVVGSSIGSVESAASKASSAASSLSEKVIGSSTGPIESVASEASGHASSIASDASKSASSVVYGESSLSDTMKVAASSVSSAIIGESSLADTVKNAASSASSAIVGESSFPDTIKAAASSASSAIVGESSFTDNLSDAASQATEAVKSKISDGENSMSPVLSSILAAQRARKEEVRNAARRLYEDASSAASSFTSTPIASEISKSASSAASHASSAASSLVDALPDADDIADAAAAASDTATASVKKVWGGANAQVLVKARQPIMDDDVVNIEGIYSERVQSIIAAAGEKGSQLTKAIQDAIHKATATQGSVESVTSLASEQYASALSAASSALFGSQNVAGMGVGAATEQYLAAVTAASYAIYGTPVTAAPLAAASSAYDSAMSEAARRYESVKSRVSEQISGTPVPAQEQALASAQSAYSAAVTVASYALYGTPITAAPLAAASSAYDSALSEAAKHYEAVKSRVSEQISGSPKPIHEEMLASAASAYSGAVNAAAERYSSLRGSAIPEYYAQISSIASSRLADGVSAAQDQYRQAKIAVGAEPTPVHQQYLASAHSAYYQALGMAHGRYSEFVEAASGIVAPTPTSTGYQASIDSMLKDARSAYSGYTSDAYSKYTVLLDIATSAAAARGMGGGDKNVDQSVLDNLEGQMVDAIDVAKSKLSVASASVSSYYNKVAATQTAKPLTEQAAENWDALLSKASEQIYGAPPPFTEQAYSHVSALTAQATEAAGAAVVAAGAQYEQIQSLVSELVHGRKADFTASVYSRLQSAYSTAAPEIVSQASVYMSDSYESVASAVSAMFVPPTEVPSILESMQKQLNDAVDAASAQVYGTEKGTVEQATSAAASMYSDAASAASEAIYGTESKYLEAAQSTVGDIGASASSAISAALYGPSSAPAVTEAAASAYSSIASQASEQASLASAAVSRALYGEEQSYMVSVQSQLQEAMASASSRIAGFGGEAAKSISEAAMSASSVVGEAASSVSSVVGEATDRIRDEL